MDKDTYQQLSDEITYNHSKQDTYTNYAYVFSATVWTIAVSANIPWLVLIPMVILVPIGLRISDCRYSIAFLSSYLAVFIEPTTSTNWHMVREKYYKKHKRSLFDRFAYHGQKIDIPFLCSISMAIFWMLRGGKLVINEWITIAVVVFQVFIIVFNSIVCLRNSDMSKLKQPMINNWKSIYDEYYTLQKERKDVKSSESK